MPDIVELDHTGINVQYDMDRAEGLFGALGFFLTERGHHSMGSINHLMVFGPDYMELVGLPPGFENPQTDFGALAPGINGLVFRTTDVDAIFAHLQEIDMHGLPPKAFNRPVQGPEGAAMARFRTVAVRPGIFPGGRVYYCEHGTPELVWRPEWQSHANGTLETAEFVVVSGASEVEAENFARLLQSAIGGPPDQRRVALARGQITIITPAAYGERYGALASPMAERGSIFGALVLRTDSLAKIRDIVANMASPVPMIDEATRVVVREPNFDCVFEFIH